jgi:hypothetical protein
MIIDGTFNINELRLSLLTAVGVSNFNKTILLAFSYSLSKSEKAFTFFFNSLNKVVFLKGVKFVKDVNTEMPKVILSD